MHGSSMSPTSQTLVSQPTILPRIILFSQAPSKSQLQAGLPSFQYSTTPFETGTPQQTSIPMFQACSSFSFHNFLQHPGTLTICSNPLLNHHLTSPAHRY